MSHGYNMANKMGVERAKIKLGLRENNNENLTKDWDKFGCDGNNYRKLLEGRL